MNISCSVVEDGDLLARHERAWAALLERSRTDVPTLSPVWLLPWWRVFGGRDDRRLKVGLFHAGDRLVGVAPLLARRHSYRPGIPFRRLEALGSGEREEDEICSEYLGVLAERGAERAVYAALAEGLAAGSFGPWDELVIPAMDGSLPLPELLAGALKERGFAASVEATGACRRAPLPPTWEAYLEGLTAAGRYLIRRSMRDLERWAGGDMEIRRAGSPADLEEGKRALASLHEERWRGAGAFRSPLFQAFHDEVLPALLARGSLDLTWMIARGAPVAALYNVRWSGRSYFYQCGRSLGVPPEVRPGIVIHARAIQRAIADGLSTYDLLEGSSQYKRALARAEAPLVAVRAVKSASLEAARRAASLGAATARRARRAIAFKDDRGRPPDPTAILYGDLSMLRCFGGAGVRTLSISTDPRDVTFASRHCQGRRVIADPAIRPAEAARDLAAIGRGLAARPALFYGDDAILLAISRHRGEISPHFRFRMPPADLVETLVDKAAFAALAARLALPVPRTVTSADAGDLRAIIREVGLPCIVKPSHHIGWRASEIIAEQHGGRPFKALVAESEAELARILAGMRARGSGFVVQERIPGGEDQIHTFHAYLDARRRILGQYVGKKIRTYPRTSGESTLIELVEEPRLAALGREILERLDLVGVVKLDFKRDPRDGRFSLLEVNPRYNLWNRLGAAAGVNLPLLAYRDLMDEPSEPVRGYRTGIRWLSFGADLRAFLGDYAPAGELTFSAWLRSLWGHNVYDVFAWDDARPLLYHLGQSMERRLRRALAGTEGTLR